MTGYSFSFSALRQAPFDKAPFDKLRVFDRVFNRTFCVVQLCRTTQNGGGFEVGDLLIEEEEAVVSGFRKISQGGHGNQGRVVA